MNTPAIGFKIREHRKRQGLTQTAMARELEISPSYLNLIESNKRTVGGKLLTQLAHCLELEVDELSGAVEQRLSDDLRELPNDSILSHINLESNFADEIVAHNPTWARMILAIYRAYLDKNQALSILSNRLNADPLLQSSVHRMLTHITSIRSTAEILNDMQKISKTQQQRFHSIIHSESTELTNVAQQLISSFEMQDTSNPSTAAAEEVDDFIIAHRNYFPLLEQAADSFNREVKRRNESSFDSALIDFLEDKLDIRVEILVDPNKTKSHFRNQTSLDTKTKTLYFLANAPQSTRRFQMIRVASEITYADAIKEVVEDPRLSTDAARQQATHALAAYLSGAAMLPYESFLNEAEQSRYDIELLRQKFDAGFEQVCHRLVTLHDPRAEGIPFAFLRVDPSGHFSKRFPLAQFPLPRYGNACPLWSVFAAFQTPGRVIRQLVEFPDTHRFLMIARTVTKRATDFHAQPVTYALMIACDAIHADRTVYAAGIDLGSKYGALEVGPNCKQCSRINCQHRQEPTMSTLQ